MSSGRTGEVNKLSDTACSSATSVSDFLFQEILYRFHVVVSGALDGFDALRVFNAEIGDDFIKETVCVGSKSRKLP